MVRSAGHLIVDQLAAGGVRRLYCVPGESYLDILDGLYDAPVEAVVCRQEGGAGFMALAESRLTGVPGVAAVTRGPGAANAFIAVHTAWQDRTPLLLIVGLVPVTHRNREAFQEFDPAGWFGSTAKKVLVLDDPETAADLVVDALHTAVSGRPGPVVLGLPEDLLTRTTDAPVLLPRAVAGPVPAAGSIEEFRRLLDAARHPVVVAGGEGWTDRSAAALARWAARCSLPVVTDFRAYDLVDHDAPVYCGTLGYGRDPRLADRLDRADLLVFLGAVRGDVLSDGFTLGLDATTVVIDPDPDVRGHGGRLDLQIVSTPAAFLATVLGTDDGDPAPAPAAAAAPTAGRRCWLEGARAQAVAYATPHPDGGAGVDLGIATALLRGRLERDAIVTYGAGNHALWAQRYLPHHGPGSLVGPRNGAMGVGVPAAVAASIVFPGRQVVCFTGDGCFLMNGQELATAAAYGATPLVVVVDNGCFGTIRQHQERRYPGRPSGTGLTNPDFATLARSYGGFGRRLDRTEQVADALDEAIAATRGEDGGPARLALLHLVVDPRTRVPRACPETEEDEQ